MYVCIVANKVLCGGGEEINLYIHGKYGILC